MQLLGLSERLLGGCSLTQKSQSPSLYDLEKPVLTECSCLLSVTPHLVLQLKSKMFSVQSGDVETQRCPHFLVSVGLINGGTEQ